MAREEVTAAGMFCIGPRLSVLCTRRAYRTLAHAAPATPEQQSPRASAAGTGRRREPRANSASGAAGTGCAAQPPGRDVTQREVSGTNGIAQG